MFNPYDEQLENDAISYGAAGDPQPAEIPDYAPVRSPDRSIGVTHPTGRVKDPTGSRYNNMRPTFIPSALGLGGLSGRLAQSATSLVPDRMAARDSEQNVTTENRPAQFAPANLSTSVTHTDMPFDRSRVDDIFNHQTTRRFAY